ncbi:MAG: hypothetical protein AAF467_26085 [Actinomycetota bacterium]
MRERVLLASVRRHLGADASTAVYLGRTGRLTVPFALVAVLACAALATAVGFDRVSSVVGIGLVGGAVAWLAGTEYRVLAVLADGELRLLRGSRFRQVAVAALDERVDRHSIRQVSSTAVSAQWRVGNHHYTVNRRHQPRLAALAAPSR